ncbi:hypothetical protein [Desemzia sp. FAM 24101]|uniref:hypothetical protein n=1 Tax=unclassified Desemzia TaxID=2685243 RepID=UPI00388A6626
MDFKTLNSLSKEELVQLVIDQSEETKRLENQLDAEVEENRFIKSLGFVDGFQNYQSYFIRFFEDESEGTAKKGSIFLGLFNDFIQDYGRESVIELLDQYMDGHI